MACTLLGVLSELLDPVDFAVDNCKVISPTEPDVELGAEIVKGRPYVAYMELSPDLGISDAARYVVALGRVAEALAAEGYRVQFACGQAVEARAL